LGLLDVISIAPASNGRKTNTNLIFAVFKIRTSNEGFVTEGRARGSHNKLSDRFYSNPALVTEKRLLLPCDYKQSAGARAVSRYIRWLLALGHGYATKEGCRTERKSCNLEYAMGVRLTGFTT
jgi:hypothetical protein